MRAKELILDPAQFDFNNIVADIEEIRRYNPQRFEMEQLTAIFFEDSQRLICAGYKDVTDQEFWCRGHMPGMPLMPGVMVCEAVAQVCAYYTQKHDLLKGAKVVGFGGIEEMRFRDPVLPGSRLAIVCQQIRVRPRALIICQFQAFVGETMVAEGSIKGIPLPVDHLTNAQGTVGQA